METDRLLLQGSQYLDEWMTCSFIFQSYQDNKAVCNRTLITVGKIPTSSRAQTWDC